MNIARFAVRPDAMFVIGRAEPDRGMSPDMTDAQRELQRHIAIAATHPRLQRAAAEAVIDACRQPGRAGVRSVSNFLTSAPRAALPDCIRAVWRLKPSRAAWATALLTTWIGTSQAVVEAAGTIEELAAWFARADLLQNPPAFVAHGLYRWDELPPEFPVWRGATTARGFADRGLSWSRFKDTAAVYAVARVEQHGGSPLICRATMRRSQVVLVTRTSEQETVSLAPPKGEMDTCDPEEIRTLLESAAARRSGAVDPTLSLGADDDDEAWCGWTGDDD